LEQSPEEREKQIRKIVDDTGFNGRVFFVAVSGFLASSYSLFSTTVTTPVLYFVYPPCGRLAGRAGLVIDQITLVGTVLGMLIVGHAADLFGQKRLYGMELVAIMIATMGLVQAGEGFMYHDSDNVVQHSMDIYSWIAWWRGLLGFGIGAGEFP
jgi:PHS family inorganic phosphate transporter-like MFS transporter